MSVISKNLLDRNTAAKSISGSRVNGRPCNEFLELTGIRKSNIKNLPRDIQNEVDNLIGQKTATILLRKS